MPLATCLVLAANSIETSGPDVVSFQGLGDLPGGRFESYPISVSADGRVVTGWSVTMDGTRAFRWKDGSMAELAGGGLTPHVGHALSADGSVVVGMAVTSGGTAAFRWEDGQAAALPSPVGMSGIMDAWGVSGDGQTIGGTISLPDQSNAVLWTETKVSLLADLPGGRMSSTVSGISSDGSTVVGYSESDKGIEAVAWRGDTLLRLEVLPGGEWHSEARAVSEDGRIIVGSSASAHGTEAFKWHDGKMTALGSLSREHEFLSSARGLSRDGAIIVGSAMDDRDSSQAVVWDAFNGARSLQTILTLDFRLNLTGWRLEAATGVSADGRTIIGTGRNPQGQPEGWMVRLPPDWWVDRTTPFRPNLTIAATESKPGPRSRLGRGNGVLGPLSEPRDAAIDSAGSVYIADSGGNAIRVFDPSGVLRQTWGSPGSGLQFDGPAGIAATIDGFVAVADTGRHRVQIIVPDGRLLRMWGRRGADSGAFNLPEGIAVHQGRVYVADTGNDRIQVFDERGGWLRTFGRYGHGTGELNRPSGLCVHEDGRVFVADRANDRIGVFDAQGSWVGSWGERGTPPGFFNRPTGIECLGDDVYVVDQANHRIQVFDVSGTLRYVWGRQALRPREAGGRISFPAQIAIAPDQTRAVICEPTEDRCQSFGMIEEAAGSGFGPSAFLDAGPLSGVAASLHVGNDILTMIDDAAGHVLVYRITDSNPILMTKVGVPGYGAGQLSDPRGLWFDDVSSSLLIADTGNRRIQVFEIPAADIQAKPFAPNQAKLRKSFGFHDRRHSASAESNTHFRPRRLALASNGVLAVVNEADDHVVLFDSGFHELRRLGGPPSGEDELMQPIDVAFCKGGQQILVLDAMRPGVIVFDLEGTYIRAWGGRGSEPSEFLSPGGITAGRDGFVYVSDLTGCRIQKFDEDGNFVMQWGLKGSGGGEFFHPRDVAQDGQGCIYVNDYGNRRIQVFTADGQFLRAIGSPLAIHPTLVDRPR